MKVSKSLILFVFISVFSLTSCSKDSSEIENINTIEVPVAPQAKLIEIEIMELINAHRLNVGLTPLQHHSTVKAVASTHTAYMIEVNNISHDNFFLRKESLQVNAAANIVSENVAFGFNSATAVVNAWLNSPGHKDNIEGDYTDFDISAEKNNEDKWYFTNIFIKR